MLNDELETPADKLSFLPSFVDDALDSEFCTATEAALLELGIVSSLAPQSPRYPKAISKYTIHAAAMMP